MTKQLSEAQIEHLHEFCEKHYVPYYDLQVELVDHLASAIERRLENEPHITFEQALNDTYKEFGISGFSRVSMAREKELVRKYRRMLWSYVVQFFKLPKIVLTIALSTLLFMLFRSTDKDLIVIVIYLLSIVTFMILYFFHIYPKYLKIKPKENQKLLIVQALNKMQAEITSAPIALFNLAILFNENAPKTFNLWIELAIAIFISISVIVIVAFLVYLPKKIKQHFEEQFPQLVKA